MKFINSNATDEEVQRAVEIACADTFINELPQGLMTVIGERGMGLSEGQVQRLAIARSLLSKSPVLLLDEATSALDEETEHRFLKNLKALQNVTCIIVSHKRAALRILNKHVRIEDCKIVSEERLMMLTEWGKQLDKSCPLSEYPRPQFVRDSYLSLNGMWQCAFTRDSTVPVQMDTAICVPFSPETPLFRGGAHLKARRVPALSAHLCFAGEL